VVQGSWTARVVPVVLGLAVVAGVVVTVATRISGARAALAASAHRPLETRGDGYVSSKECRACHPTQYESWHASYHRTMTQVATPETVLGAFDGARFELHGRSYRFGREDGRAWVEMDALDGQGLARHPIALVTGSHHMQVYWFESGKARWLAQAPFVYLVPDRRWIPRRAAFLRPPGPRGDDFGRWNLSCVNCHTTRGQPRIADQTADTHVAEFGIACEACHGPAETHVRANALPIGRYRRHLDGASDPTIVQPASLSHSLSSEICGHCHGLWNARDDAAQAHALAHGSDFRPGQRHQHQWLFQPTRRAHDPMVDRVMREVPGYADGQFWADGMPRASSREYHGVIESPCYQGEDFGCLSCHAMHKQADDPRSPSAWADDQLAVGMDGDRACTQCHAEIARAPEKHTFHAPGSNGSRCYNCHMPHTSYGILKAIRSHQVSSPDVANTLAVGRPNACNLCHLDKSLAWAADALRDRWGIAPPTPDSAVAADYAGVPAGALWALKGDAGQRALVAAGMGWAPAREAAKGTWFPAVLAELLDDPYDAVRIVAGRALLAQPGFEDFAFDPVPMPFARKPAAPGAVARWQELRDPGAVAPEPLFTPSGERDAEVFSRLLRERDHKTVHLLE
jgi:hypothetical protein